MTAHIFNGNLDSEYPATLSKNILTGVLRNQLGFDGVIISDDMNMSAITDHYGLEQAIELGITAGLDILIFANNLTYDEMIAEEAVEIIKELVDNGSINEDSINESYYRIINLKNRILDF
ncbi:MAG: glycoside hydrolase family 3 N-terminal domain-containing protein [Ignavibacteria bacterium]|jgi:beta-N-acetylhexosaminidase